MLIGGQWIEHAHIDAELLFEQLQQRDIHNGILISQTDNIVLTRLAHNIHRQHQQRGVAGQCALLVLIPLQQAQYHKQRVSTILFEGVTRCSVNEFQSVVQLCLTKIGCYLFVFFNCRHHFLAQRRSLHRRVVHAIVLRLDKFFRIGGDGIVAAFL